MDPKEDPGRSQTGSPDIDGEEKLEKRILIEIVNFLLKVVFCGKVSNQSVGDDGSFPRAEARITVQNIVVNENRHGG